MSVNPSTTARRRWVLVVFVLAVLVIPAQLVVKALANREPYPAIAQPAFAYSAAALPGSHVIPKAIAVVEVTFDDGTTETLSAAELIPWTAGISQTTILTESLLDPAEPAVETIEWLADKIADARPGRHAASARVTLYSLRIDALTLQEVQRSVSDEVTVRFDS